MSKYIGHVCLLFTAALLLASCLNTDSTEESTLYDDIAITKFQITTAKIYKHTTSSTGKDSVYFVTDERVKNYEFYIDQLKGEIYNVDSLPLGTDASKLLCECSTKNNAIAYIENEMRDSLKPMSTTDSIDFTNPRYVRAYASDGKSYRQYRITVGVHKESAGEFRWTRLADNSRIQALGAMRMVALGGRMLLFGQDGGRTVMYYTDETDGSAWAESGVAFGADAYNNVVVRNDTLFVLDGGRIKMSADGVSFTDAADGSSLRRLVGGSTTELYAIDASGVLAVSSDGGRSWSADRTDTGAAMLPSRDITSCTAAFGYTDSTDYVVLAGNRSEEAFASDSTAVVWRKIVEYSADSDKGKWVYVEADSNNGYQLPRLAGLTVLAYGDSKIAFGGAGIGTCRKEAFSQMYESRDGGITWKRNPSYVFSDGFDSSATAFAAAVDSRKNIWIVCGGTGQVWRGRLNSMGWTEQ